MTLTELRKCARKVAQGAVWRHHVIFHSAGSVAQAHNNSKLFSLIDVLHILTIQVLLSGDNSGAAVPPFQRNHLQVKNRRAPGLRLGLD